ncbi:MAG TPA: SGNH/GDSL hydrolase family protein, partial [Pseudomonadales bacterium]|jgi:hypothetical protein|nr:SGNH/GDSL hydrolase family protein [Pseudomonadales bacterium]
MLQKIRMWLVNGALGVFALLLTYAAVEWTFPRVFTRIFPLSMATKFDEFDGVWPLLQSTKQGEYPEDYIAVVGDSYAMGMGDAMYEGWPNPRQPRFSSAPTIQDLTGRDVVTFGQPGSGSIRGAISNPIGALHYLRRVVDKDFPAPSWMLVYFYEGNDLTENWMYYEKTFLPDHAAADYEQPSVFDQYIRDVALGRQHLYLAGEAATWKNRLFFYRFAYRVFAENVFGKKFYKKKYPNEFGLIYVPQARWVPRKVAEPVNHAWINGQSTPLPDNLQGPSLDLSQNQLEQAVGTFDKALAWSRGHFPNTRFAVVYIPSVLSVYHLAGSEVEAQNLFSDSATRFTVAAVEQRHTWMVNAIAQASQKQGVTFIDATPDLRQAAETQTLHGPHDWNHFSRRGYEILGTSVVRQLPALRTK